MPTKRDPDATILGLSQRGMDHGVIIQLYRARWQGRGCSACGAPRARGPTYYFRTRSRLERLDAQLSARAATELGPTAR